MTAGLSDIAPIAVRARRIGELLITPCKCGKQNCTLGEHIWHSTKDMSRGVRASNTDPGGGNRWWEDDDGTVWPVPNDPTGDAATDQPDDTSAEYVALLDAFDRIGDQLEVFVGKHRPDRRLHTVVPGAELAWCAHHLATIGTCEPRHRGDLCRTCDDFRRAHNETLPPADLLTAKHEGKRWTEQMIRDSLRTAKGKKKTKRRKAS